jgi:hypothetical protein
MRTSPASVLIFCSVLFIFTFQPGFVLPLPADTLSADAAAGQEMTVKQAGFTHCSYEIFPHQAVFSPSGETIAFDVTTTSPECSWRISRPDTLKDWVFVTPGSGTGDGKVTLTVTPNPGAIREGTITLDEQTSFDITQGSESSCIYNRILSRQSFTASGTSSLVRVVVTPDNCSWTASAGDHDWIRVHPSSQVTGEGTLTLSVTPNTGDAREGVVTIAGKAFPITQDAAPVSGLTTTVRGDLKVPYSSRFENVYSSFYFLPDFKFF